MLIVYTWGMAMASEERSSTHAQRALITLRQRILGGDLPGGTRLYEVALAEELGISRTPVRAALSRLAEEALLDRTAGGGFVVRSFAVADVVDTIELRGVLEGTAARLAAERGAPEALLAEAGGILRGIDALFRADVFDMEAYSRFNAGFHHFGPNRWPANMPARRGGMSSFCSHMKRRCGKVCQVWQFWPTEGFCIHDGVKLGEFRLI
jgi:DNA-binding GntR family transcriptional regulator